MKGRENDDDDDGTAGNGGAMMADEIASKIYDRLNELSISSARIVARMDMVIDISAKEHEDFNRRIVEHNERIRELEDAKNKQCGVLAALAAIGSVVGGGIIWVVDRFVK